MVRRLLGARPAHAGARAALPFIKTRSRNEPVNGGVVTLDPAEAVSSVAERHGNRTRRGRRRVWRWSVLPLLLAVSLALLATIQLARKAPAPVTHVELSSKVVVPGKDSAMPWPAKGEAAVAVTGLDRVVASGVEKPVPIASLTKMMTAYLVLQDHPLSPAAQGPDLVMSDADEDEAGADAAANDSSVPVQEGEVLSERQLLDGLLVHSADNFADVLAEWDAGTVAAFVSKMNSTATSLGMRDTHYADASGLNIFTASTAADQLRLALKAMQIPTFATVVAQRTVSLPLAGTLSNYVSQIGTLGIIGVKSGFTQAAMGCLVLAAVRNVDGFPVVVLAAVTGQLGFDPLDAAAQATIPLLDTAASSVRIVRVLEAGQRVAEVSTQWAADKIGGVASRSVYVVAWRGESVHREMQIARVRVGAKKGADLGTVVVSVGDERSTARVSSTGDIRAPSLSWRLDHF